MVTDIGTGRKLAAGSLARVGHFVLQVVVAFLMTPVMVRALGDRDFGVWTVVGALVGYYGLFDLGIHSAVCRYVAAGLAARDRAQVAGVVSTSFVLFSWAGGAVLVLTLVAAALCTVLASGPADAGILRWLVLLLGLRTALGFPFRVYAAFLSASLRYDLTAGAAILRLILVNALLLEVLVRGHGLVAMGAVLLLGSLAESVMWVLACHWIHPGLPVGFRQYSRATRRMLLSYSWKSLVIQVTAILRLKLNAVVLAAFLNANVVTTYAIGERLATYFVEFISSLVGNLSPLFSRYTPDHQARLIKDFRLATRLSVVAATLVASAMVFYGAAFIDRWMGPGYGSSYRVMVILTIPLAIDVMQTPSIGLLYGISRHDITAVLGAVNGVTNLVLALLLARPYGIYGVAVATAAAVLLVKLVLQPVCVCRALGMPLAEGYGDLGGTLARTLAPQMLFFLVVRRWVTPDYTRLMLLAAVQGLVSVPVAVLWALGRQDLAFITAALRQRSSTMVKAGSQQKDEKR